MRTPYKIGILITLLFAIFEIYAYVVWQNHDYGLIVPYLGLILGGPLIAFYFLLTFMYLKSQKLFLYTIATIFILVTACFLLYGYNNDSDKQQINDKFNLASAKELEVGKLISVKGLGRNPMFYTYKITIPKDGDLEINIKADEQTQMFGGEPLSIYDVNKKLVASTSIKSSLRKVKKGQVYELVVNQRVLYSEGHATYFELKTDLTESNILEFNSPYNEIDLNQQPPVKYSFISLISGDCYLTLDNISNNNQSPPLGISSITLYDSRDNPVTVEKKYQSIIFKAKKGQSYYVIVDQKSLRDIGVEKYSLHLSNR